MNSKELTEQIHHNTRIILPEFGAFLVKDSGEKEFNPKNVSFSPFLRYNDGMLEVYVAKSRGISKEEASKEVHAFVETIKNELLEKGVYELEGLGLLKRDQRGSLSFTLSLPGEIKTQSEISTSDKSISNKPEIEIITPNKSDDSKDVWLEADKPIEEAEIPVKKVRKTSESKAKVEKLTTTKKTAKSSKNDNLATEEIIQENTPEPTEAIKAEKEPIPTPEPLIIASPKPTLEAKPVEKLIAVEEKIEKKVERIENTFTKEPITDEVKKRQGLTRFVYACIAFVLLIVLVLVVKNYYFPPSVVSINDSLSTVKAPKDLIKNNADVKDKIDKPKDDIDKSFNELNPDKKEKPVKTKEQIKKEEAQEEAIKNNIIKNSQNIPAVDIKYYLVAGSFKNPTFAEKYFNELKKSGYNPNIVIQSSGMNAVTIGGYSTRVEADKALKKFKEKFPNLWILKK